MESLFTKLYKYRQRENKSDLENFSTELLAHCLTNDPIFRKDFFKLISCTDELNPFISTQESYPKYGRPDIEIRNIDSIILIENKVDSSEGSDQLKRYANILTDDNKPYKYLIYLTKFYEQKNLPLAEIIYKNIKWWDIYILISDNNQEITKEFKEYLIENKIAMDQNFTTLDLVSLENIADVMSKMNEVIDSVKEYFGKRLGTFSKDSSRSTRLADKGYYNYKSIGNPWKFNVDVGYFWFWEDNTIYLGVRIWIPFKSNEKDEIIDFFRQNLVSEEWDDEVWGKTVSFGSYKKLTEIISAEDEQLPLMSNFLKTKIDILHNLKEREPKIFE